MEKAVVFHLKRHYFEQIKLGIKECEYRFKFPSALEKGSLIRFDLAYKPLSDKSAHLFARCLDVVRIPLISCPCYVFECFNLDRSLRLSDNVYIYRIEFALLRDDGSQVMYAPIVSNGG